MADLGGGGIFVLVIILVVLIFVIKCCIDSGRQPKVTRRPHDGSYQNVPTTYSSSMLPPRERIIISRTMDGTEIDGIVVIPEPNEGKANCEQKVAREMIMRTLTNQAE